MFDLFIEFHCAIFKNCWFEFVPRQSSKLVTLLTEVLVDFVDHRVDLVLALHLDEFVKLGDR